MENPQRVQYEQRVGAQLQQWRAQIDLMTAFAQEDVANSRLAHYEHLEALHAEATNKLQQLKDAAERDWSERRGMVDAALDELEAAFARLERS
jgi:hypothetical protein